jgi:uncharacterized membrane protein YfcA
MDSLQFVPDALSLSAFSGLIILSFFTSFLTASMGIGGGTVMLAVMAQVMPAKAIIPTHGLVQLGSNFGRAAILFSFVKRQHLLWFLAGSILGAIVGGRVVVSLPVPILKLVLGAFILYSVWGPRLKSLADSLPKLAVTGALSTLLTMFVGATGPFVIASLRSFSFAPKELVATSAACLVIQHSLKVMVFGLLGFVFSDYLALIGLMIATGFMGTVLGRRVLLSVDEQKFQMGLNIILSLLAVRLLLSGLNII